jgi:hypothetical protein
LSPSAPLSPLAAPASSLLPQALHQPQPSLSADLHPRVSRFYLSRQCHSLTCSQVLAAQAAEARKLASLSAAPPASKDGPVAEAQKSPCGAAVASALSLPSLASSPAGAGLERKDENKVE